MLRSSSSQPNSEGSALAVKGQYTNASRGGQPNTSNQKRNNRPWCDQCKKLGHTKETCWKLHDKPANWQPSRPNQNNQVNISAAETQKTEDTTPFNKEQMEMLQKMLQNTVQNALSTGGSSTATMAQQGNSYTALSVKKNTMQWIVDLGASDHMTGDVIALSEYRQAARGTSVRIADGTYSDVMGIGSVIISKEIKLNSVLFVPNLDYNLLSISKLTKDLNCITKFSSNMCEFQALNSGKTIGNTEMSAGLYLLRAKALGKQSQKISCAASTQNKDSIVMLWHYRLGHPNFMYLKKLFPNLINKDSAYFQCEVCQLSKHSQNSYPI